MSILRSPCRSQAKEDGNSAKRIDNRKQRQKRRRRRGWKRSQELPEGVRRCHLATSSQCLGGPLECRREQRELLARAFAISLVQCLVYPWNHNCRVARVFSRSVNRMLEPGPMRQSLRHKHRALRVDERLIQARDVPWSILLPRQDFRPCIREMPSRGIDSLEIEDAPDNLVLSPFPRRVQIGANFFALFFVVVRQNISIGHAYHFEPKNA